MKENKQKETTDDQIVSTTSKITIQIAEEFIAERKITIIDPLSDFGFKRLMATERNKDILIGFLNTFISNDAGIIVDVTFLPTSQIGVTPDEKRVRFDLYCKTAGNDHIIIEMQHGRVPRPRPFFLDGLSKRQRQSDFFQRNCFVFHRIS